MFKTPLSAWLALVRKAKATSDATGSSLAISPKVVLTVAGMLDEHFRRRKDAVIRLGELERNLQGTLAPFVRFLDVREKQGGSGWSKLNQLDITDEASVVWTDSSHSDEQTQMVASLRLADWRAARELMERTDPKCKSLREMANVPSYTEIAMALAEALNVLDEALDMEDTACDHSVGICWCDFHKRRVRLIALAKKAGV